LILRIDADGDIDHDHPISISDLMSNGGEDDACWIYEFCALADDNSFVGDEQINSAVLSSANIKTRMQ
jgi:hypothetical protein